VLFYHDLRVCDNVVQRFHYCQAVRTRVRGFRLFNLVLWRSYRGITRRGLAYRANGSIILMCLRDDFTHEGTSIY